MEVLMFFAIMFGMGLLPPFRWDARIAACLLAVLSIAVFIEPTPSDPGWGDGPVRGGVLFMTICLLAGVALRGMIFIASRSGPPPQRAEALLRAGLDRVSGPPHRGLARLPALPGAGMGLQGNPSGLVPQLWVTALGGLTTLGAMAAVARYQSRPASVVAGVGLLVTARTLDSGLRYPDLILTDANRLSPGTPRCLLLGPDLHAPRSRADLMTLTMAKDHTGPSDALLLIQTDNGPRLFRWSFRARQFVKAPLFGHSTPPLHTHHRRPPSG